VSDHVWERARAKARRWRRKPRGPHPPSPWWLYGLWLAYLVSTYLRDALEHRLGWGIFDGVMTVVYLGFVHWSLAWRRWERQEGLPHPGPGRWDWVFAVWATVLLLGNVLWLGGVR
jgi:hypothetical protein